MLSLEFARGQEKTKYLQDKAMAFVQRHRFDTESPEAQSKLLCTRADRPVCACRKLGMGRFTVTSWVSFEYSWVDRRAGLSAEKGH